MAYKKGRCLKRAKSGRRRCIKRAKTRGYRKSRMSAKRRRGYRKPRGMARRGSKCTRYKRVRVRGGGMQRRCASYRGRR